MTRRAANGEWYCRTCTTKSDGIEKCQEESSSGYHTLEDGGEGGTGEGTQGKIDVIGDDLFCEFNN